MFYACDSPAALLCLPVCRWYVTMVTNFHPSLPFFGLVVTIDREEQFCHVCSIKLHHDLINYKRNEISWLFPCGVEFTFINCHKQFIFYVRFLCFYKFYGFCVRNDDFFPHVLNSVGSNDKVCTWNLSQTVRISDFGFMIFVFLFEE